MRVLVTGAGGFVGGYLVPYLASAGHEVVGSSLEPPAAGRPPVAWEVFDLTDAEAVAECVDRVRPEGVVHLAAQASVGGSWADPRGTYRANIEGTGNLLEAVKGLRPRVLLVGSAQQYRPVPGGRPLRESDPQLAGSPYALTKIAQEQMGLMYLQHDGVPAVFTRSFNHTGPGQSSAYAVGSFTSQIARLERTGGGEMHVGSLDSRRDFCDVRDVVGAYARLLEAGEPGEAYNVCSGQSVRMGEVLGRLLEVSGLAGRVKVHERSVDAPGAPDRLVGDPSKIRAAVGWSPEIPLDRSLIDTLEWYRSLPE
ncbi:MAG TPA: GDP-mannose 4,6-dehydratase, partial [Actinomycetota bacterium]|nr:GDP-mannose 4,6-dehydratase [Actinomycetota bacterium]